MFGSIKNYYVKTNHQNYLKTLMFSRTHTLQCASASTFLILKVYLLELWGLSIIDFGDTLKI